MKPKNALLLAAGTAIAGTALLASRRTPTVAEPRLGPTILIVAQHSRVTNVWTSATAAKIDEALRGVNLAGGTWLGSGPRITRFHRETTTGTYQTTVAQPVTWPSGANPTTQRGAEQSALNHVATALRDLTHSSLPGVSDGWDYIVAVPYDPTAFGPPSFWISGKAALTATRESPIDPWGPLGENVREDPVGPRDAGNTSQYGTSATCCRYILYGVTAYAAWKSVGLVTEIYFPGTTGLIGVGQKLLERSRQESGRSTEEAVRQAVEQARRAGESDVALARIRRDVTRRIAAEAAAEAAEEERRRTEAADAKDRAKHQTDLQLHEANARSLFRDSS